MNIPTPPPPGWYPDPADRSLVRWWDGGRWTEHTHPAQRADVSGLEFPIDRARDPARVQRQAQRGTGGGPVAGGDGTLFTEPVLVVNQKAKLVEVVTEYSVFDQHGRQLGSVVQVGQNSLAKAVRIFTNYDRLLTTALEVRDAAGAPVLRVTRPGAVFKSRVQVTRPDGTPVGDIVQENLIGKIRFALVVDGAQVGSLNAQNWRAWNFSITDSTGSEVARVSKTWEGFARSMFTTADNYVVQVHRPLPDPLASLVVASALTVDTVLKQSED